MPYRRILVPVMGNDDDQRAIELAGILSAKRGSEVTLVYVVEVKQALPLDADLPDAVAFGEKALADAADFAREKAEHRISKVAVELVQARRAGPAIVDEATERGIDIIVMASRNRVVLGRMTIGETMPYILQNAPCEVLLERAGFDQ